MSPLTNRISPVISYPSTSEVPTANHWVHTILAPQMMRILALRVQSVIHPLISAPMLTREEGVADQVSTVS